MSGRIPPMPAARLAVLVLALAALGVCGNDDGRPVALQLPPGQATPASPPARGDAAFTAGATAITRTVRSLSVPSL